MPDISGYDQVTLGVFLALILLSVSATTLTIYKIVQFALLGLGKTNLANAILGDWHAGRQQEALLKATKGKGALLRVLRAVIAALVEKPDEKPWAEEIGRQIALSELARLGKWMRGLEAVVQAAPMLGLLGTVIGMINAFGALAESSGGVDPALLAGGIWTALTTTAIGLTIALVFYFIAIWLEGRIETERQSMENLLSSTIHGKAEWIGVDTKVI